MNPEKLIDFLNKRRELRKSNVMSLAELAKATEHKSKDQDFFFWYLKKGVISKELTKEIDPVDQLSMLRNLNLLQLDRLRTNLINKTKHL